METSRFFFILGMPRARTAWLAALLTGGDVHCFHEGTAGHGSFAEYAEALRGRPEAMVGDSNPSLVYHLEALTAEFPEAPLLLVRRDPAEALQALLAAAPKHEAEGIGRSWPGYMQAVERAAARPNCREISVEELGTLAGCAGVSTYLTGTALSVARWELLRDLRITSTFPPVVKMPKPAIALRQDFQVPADAGFDFTGLSARLYEPGDAAMVDAWFRHHKDHSMAGIPLPPLGVVVQDARGPMAAMWCFESYGAGVAWIELPISRPGLSLREASQACAYAALALVSVAGKGYEPPAEFTRFRAACPPAMAPVLKRLGFVEAAPRANLLLTI